MKGKGFGIGIDCLVELIGGPISTRGQVDTVIVEHESHDSAVRRSWDSSLVNHQSH